MKVRTILIAGLLSAALVLLLTPLAAPGHEYKFTGVCIVYSVLTVYLLHRNPTKPFQVLLILVIPVLVLYLPLHLLSFQSTLIALPSSMAHVMGILSGLLIYKFKKLRITFIAILITTLGFVQFYGYEKWIDGISYGFANDLINSKAPDLSFLDEAGLVVESAHFQNKTVVLDFWATWCGPCFEKFPILQQLSDKHADDKNVLIYAVNIPWKTDSAFQSHNALKKFKYTFPNLVSNDSLMVQKLGIKYFPTTLVIKDGVITYIGGIENIEEQIQ